jgi:hypothetical protein
MKNKISSFWRSWLWCGSVCAAVAIATPAIAGKRADDGARDLLLMCQGRYEDPELGLAMCTAYLKGYLDRASFTNVEGGSVEFCSATGKITPKSAAMAITRLAFSDPNAIDEPMPVFLSLALQRAFPCTEEMAAKLRDEPEMLEPPPPPPPQGPRGAAGAVGAAKLPVPAPLSAPPEKLTGRVNDNDDAEQVTKTDYTGPKAGPAGDLPPASAPRPLADHQAPAASPGSQKQSQSNSTEIVVRPQSNTNQPLKLATPFADAAGKQPLRPVIVPKSMSEPVDAAIPHIKPPTTMSNATPVANNLTNAAAEQPRTKPYGAVKIKDNDNN